MSPPTTADSRPLEEYALIGDLHTAALISRDGSLDWLCFPRFDSPACFAALLGRPEHGRWLLTPAGEVRSVKRHYRESTLVLETEYETAEGTVLVIDFMPVRSHAADLVRLVVGQRGRVVMRMQMIIRTDYGWIVPWVRHTEDGIIAIAGPDTLLLRTAVALRGEDFTTVAEFAVEAGQRVSFDLTWYPSHQEPPQRIDPEVALSETTQFWQSWSGRCNYQGPWREAVIRSLITLKALTYAPTGGIVAALTTSLPEHVGGVRNWDYRYCWLRDATFTLLALLDAGYVDEARAWREWLLRAAAGSPSKVQIMYGLAGERRLTELELPWLPGYENSKPVRVGNAAYNQLQLDVYGEVLDALHQCWHSGLTPGYHGWQLERALLAFVGSGWEQPDEGIWEVRGPRRHFTHSKVMAWVAVDRAIKGVEQFGLAGPVEAWRRLRADIHDQVCREGYSTEVGAFVQSYGSNLMDASLLMIPLVGFLPPEDARVLGTIAAVQRHLMRDGFVARYSSSDDVDGLPSSDSTFLLCSFWLADNLHITGRHDEALEVFERLLAIRNDVGLLSECYDTGCQRLVGNYPQAFSHIGIVNTARNLSRPGLGPADERRGR